MNIPIWAILVIIIIIIAITFIILQTHNSRHNKWENEANFLLKECGYSTIPKLSIVESNKTYISGRKNKNNKTSSARIYLCTTKKSGEQYDNNTIMTALIHELAHAIEPDADHNDAEFLSVIEKLSLCASILKKCDPFSKIDPDYPFDEK